MRMTRKKDRKGLDAKQFLEQVKTDLDVNNVKLSEWLGISRQYIGVILSGTKGGYSLPVDGIKTIIQQYKSKSALKGLKELLD